MAAQFARNNSQGLKAENGKTDMHKNSFFPRTVRDWKKLHEATVSAKSIEEFKDHFSTHDQY